MTGSEHVLAINDVGKTFISGAQEVEAVRSFSLTLGRGEFVSIVGPSGCGKSTLLRMIAGLEGPSAGEIVQHRADATRPMKAVAFQDYSIFPWKTVVGNIAFGLRSHGMRNAEAKKSAARWARRMGLSGFEKSYPAQLSGGMKQRVALARALAVDPELLLLDEPFAALDAQLRQVFQEDLLQLWQEGPTRSAIFVTHSLDEAILLSDRVVLTTARPATVKWEFAVPFDRPRVPELRNSLEFTKLRGEIWEMLQDEVSKAVAWSRNDDGGALDEQDD